MDFLTKKSYTEMQFYLNECKGDLGVCFNLELPQELLEKTPVHSFYYYQKQQPKQHSTIKFIQGEIEELPFLTDSIDVFVIWHNLNYHPHPEQIIRELWRALSPDGVLLILGANNPCFFSRGKENEHLIKRSGLLLNLIHQGFNVEVEHTFGFHPAQPPSWLHSWLNSIEVIGQFCTPMMGSYFLLQARKCLFGLNNPMTQPVRKSILTSREVAQPSRLKI